jgi:hypothetical protein
MKPLSTAGCAETLAGTSLRIFGMIQSTKPENPGGRTAIDRSSSSTLGIGGGDTTTASS